MIACPGGRDKGHLLITLTFRCACGQANRVTYQSNHADSLDYRCPKCGAYYKKAVRISEEQILYQEMVRLCSHCPCSDDGKIECCHCKEIVQ